MVPGKLLGSGDVAGAPTIVAYSVSAGARAKVEAAGGRVMSLRELMDENRDQGWLSLPEATTYVYDADGAILGRLANAVADLLQKASATVVEDKVVIVNAEKAIVTGSPVSIMANYHAKYELNHARKGPYFPRMPTRPQADRAGMLPYQKKSSAAVPSATCVWRLAARPTWTATCPTPRRRRPLAFERPLDRYMSLGDISAGLGAPRTAGR